MSRKRKLRKLNAFNKFKEIRDSIREALLKQIKEEEKVAQETTTKKISEEGEKLSKKFSKVKNPIEET